MGLNATAGPREQQHEVLRRVLHPDHYIQLAPNAVVILNRLCYASGNSESGPANPTKSVAMKRADNFGAGFLRAGAKAVFAEAIDSASYTISALFKSDRTTNSIFMNHPEASGARDFYFWSTRTSGYKVHSDAPKAGKCWRSLIGVALKASTWRGTAPTAFVHRNWRASPR